MIEHLMQTENIKILPIRPKSLHDGIRITVISLCLQVFFILSKAIIGYLGNSAALLADSFHSVSDMFSDIALIIGLHMASRPKDSTHHYGHGKIENYVTHIIGMMIVFLGGAIFYHAVSRIVCAVKPSTPHIMTIIPAIICIIVQEILYRVTIKTGKKIKSRGVIANAWHHRSDAMTSVITLIGIALTRAFPKLYFMDMFMAGIIACFVISVGFHLFWQAIKDIIDTAPSKKIYNRIVTTTQNVKGVVNVHNVRARYYSSYIFLDAHVKVDPSISVKAGHDIAHAVVDALKAKIPDLIDVVIHIEPSS